MLSCKKAPQLPFFSGLNQIDKGEVESGELEPTISEDDPEAENSGETPTKSSAKPVSSRPAAPPSASSPKSPVTSPKPEMPKTMTPAPTPSKTVPSTPVKPKPVAAIPTPVPPPSVGLETLITKTQFESMFSKRIAFYSYEGLVAAANDTKNFAKEGSAEVRKRELAALLGNGAQESDSFQAIREYNTAAYDHYCMPSSPGAPCASGKQYYGRGPIQLSWNYNYKAFGDFVGIDLLNNPDRIAEDSKLAWQSMMWFWMTQGTVTPHQAMTQTTGAKGFGETIRAINGGIECNKGGTPQVESRKSYFNAALNALGINAGSDPQGC